MKNLLYFQSGGPTSVINTSLYGVIKEAKSILKLVESMLHFMVSKVF